jgi:hypothetical protein
MLAATPDPFGPRKRGQSCGDAAGTVMRKSKATRAVGFIVELLERKMV